MTRGETTAEYRCYLLGYNDKIVAVETAVHSDDAAAIAWAGRVLDDRPHHGGVELWRGVKLVHRKIAHEVVKDAP